MSNLQLYSFNSNEVRVLIDQQNNPWFNAKDVCHCLAIKQSSVAVKSLDEDEKVVNTTHTLGGKQKSWFVNESGMYSLIFQSRKAEAKQFKKWVTSEVLPSIRKTGSYNLKGLILPNPTTWEKTYPHEFMRNAMRLYGYTYDKTLGTPQFIGKFINKYVYNCLDRSMERELKKARDDWKGEKSDMAFLHQFLSEPGREGLKSHIITINALMANANNIDSFDESFNRVFTRRNQLEMYLR